MDRLSFSYLVQILSMFKFSFELQIEKSFIRFGCDENETYKICCIFKL